MGKTKIEWTASKNNDGSLTAGVTWNPLRARVRKDAVQIAYDKGYTSLFKILTGVKSDGSTPRVIPGETWGYHCSVCSPGCQRCYACTLNGRTLPAWGTGLPFDRRSQDLIEIYLDEAELVKPFHWKTPRKVFPCSMTDMFGEFVPFEFIDRMFGVMALTPHTYQILSKRSTRVVEYITGPRRDGWTEGYIADHFGRPARFFPREFKTLPLNRFDRMPWPLPNVQLGFSAEDQQRFDERWKAMRELDIQRWFVWASLEPLLGPIDASSALGRLGSHLSWAVCGGESGPRARPLEVNWIRDLIRQFAQAKLPLFVKQLGSIPLVAAARQQHYDWGAGIGMPDPKFTQVSPTMDKWRIHLKDRKGGTPAEWAEHLRVREFPTVTA